MCLILILHTRFSNWFIMAHKLLIVFLSALTLVPTAQGHETLKRSTLEKRACKSYLDRLSPRHVYSCHPHSIFTSAFTHPSSSHLH
jgi:hypothetical protein